MRIEHTIFYECIKDISDHRATHLNKHLLLEVILISLLATLAGAESFNDIELFGKTKEGWLRTFLKLPNGIPSHDTFNRILSRIKPEELNDSLIKLTQALSESLNKHVPIDGKSLRRSFDCATQPNFLHSVSAWSSENNFVLGQIRTEAKSNEITAIPKLISMLDLRGSTVTIDAIGCQREIVQNIVKSEADYVIALKGNQKSTFEQAQSHFDTLDTTESHGLVFTQHYKKEKNRDRIETREVCSIDVSNMECFNSWLEIKSITRVISTREIKAKETTKTRYYISSLPADAEHIGLAVRLHWGIENKLHWVLDVNFKEDYARNRKDHSAENMAILRRIALNLINKDADTKISKRGKRLKASWDIDYLLKLFMSKIL